MPQIAPPGALTLTTEILLCAVCTVILLNFLGLDLPGTAQRLPGRGAALRRRSHGAAEPVVNERCRRRPRFQQEAHIPDDAGVNGTFLFHAGQWRTKTPEEPSSAPTWHSPPRRALGIGLPNLPYESGGPWGRLTVASPRLPWSRRCSMSVCLDATTFPSLPMRCDRHERLSISSSTGARFTCLLAPPACSSPSPRSSASQRPARHSLPQRTLHPKHLPEQHHRHQRIRGHRPDRRPRRLDSQRLVVLAAVAQGVYHVATKPLQSTTPASKSPDVRGPARSFFSPRTGLPARDRRGAGLRHR